MDEILASIRRIIESNDPVPSAGLATTMAEPAGFAGAPANDDAGFDDVSLTVDDDLVVQAFEEENAQNEKADRVSLHAGTAYVAVEAPAEQAAEPSNAPKALSLADVAARVRAASERNIAMRDHQHRHAAGDEADEEEDVPANPLITSRMAYASAGAVSDRDGEGRNTSPSAPVSIELDVEDDDEGEEVHLEIDDQLARKAEEIDRQSLSAEAPDDGSQQHRSRQPLLSPATGDHVARSFDDLASAMKLSQRRSFDEIAAELLRPMLQEWLDDNLPTLVERLVREEIERVARGPRR
jgi:hypothetical protein